ncbi:hypothetical protein RKD48_008058, partial [Streptomyces ambofaciens]
MNPSTPGKPHAEPIPEPTPKEEPPEPDHQMPRP